MRTPKPAAAKIKMLLKRSGDKQITLARMCGLTKSAPVYAWKETGSITKENLSTICKHWKLTSDEFINLDVDELAALYDTRNALGAPPWNPEAPSPTAVPVDGSPMKFSVGALEVAWAYDNLPDELSRLKLRASLMNLELRSPFVAPASPALPASAAPSPARAPRKPAAAPPKKKHGPRSKSRP